MIGMILSLNYIHQMKKNIQRQDSQPKSQQKKQQIEDHNTQKNENKDTKPQVKPKKVEDHNTQKSENKDTKQKKARSKYSEK